MSKHFQLLDFLRRAPKKLLRAYCEKREVLAGFDWGSGRAVPAERVASALQQVGSKLCPKIVTEFRELSDLAGPGFTRGLMNEAKFHRDDEAYENLSKVKSHIGKALWAFLERPSFLPNAIILNSVDKLPPGAWIKRGTLPARPGPVDQTIVAALEDALVEFFTRTQFRGHNCKIDCLQQNGEEIFYAYSEDHPDTELVWSGNQLTPQLRSPVFSMIFRHNDNRRTLDIYVEDDRTIVPKLQKLFAIIVLGEDIAEQAGDKEPIYELSRMLEPGFEFQYADDLEIKNVRIKEMRFVVDGDPWRRFTAEADNLKDRQALDNFVATLTTKLPKARLFLDRVCINVTFHPSDGDRRTPSRTFYITYPNSIRLKKDPLGERIAEMLVQSGIEREIVAKED